MKKLIFTCLLTATFFLQGLEGQLNLLLMANNVVQAVEKGIYHDFSELSPQMTPILLDLCYKKKIYLQTSLDDCELEMTHKQIFKKVVYGGLSLPVIDIISGCIRNPSAKEFLMCVTIAMISFVVGKPYVENEINLENKKKKEISECLSRISKFQDFLIKNEKQK